MDLRARRDKFKLQRDNPPMPPGVVIGPGERPAPEKPLAKANKRIYKRILGAGGKTKARRQREREKAARGGKRRPPRPKNPAPSLVVVHLTQRHVHGTGGTMRAYGPGTVTVHERIAAVLREAESRCLAAEQRLYQNKAFIINPVGGGGYAQEINPDSFTQVMQHRMGY